MKNHLYRVGVSQKWCDFILKTKWLFRTVMNMHSGNTRLSIKLRAMCLACFYSRYTGLVTLKIVHLFFATQSYVDQSINFISCRFKSVIHCMSFIVIQAFDPVQGNECRITSEQSQTFQPSDICRVALWYTIHDSWSEGRFVSTWLFYTLLYHHLAFYCDASCFKTPMRTSLLSVSSGCTATHCHM